MSLEGTESHTQGPHKEAIQSIHNLSLQEKLVVYITLLNA